MNLDAEVQLSAVVQDSSPFVIYGIKLNTEFSNHIIRKRYTDFLRFHEKLCCFSHVYCRNGTKVLDMIPKLPCQSFFYKATSQKTIQERIQALNSYVKFLIKMIDKDYDNKP